MIFKDIQDWVSKDKRKKERAKAVHKIVVGTSIVASVALAGVATGILIAPKSGKTIREDIKKKALKTVETIKDTVCKTAETVKNTVDHAAQETENVIKEVHEEAEDIKNNTLR